MIFEKLRPTLALVAVLFLSALALPSHGAEATAIWPDGTSQQIREDLVGLRLRVARETRGDPAGQKFLTEEFARNPRPEVKAFMAWIHFFGKGWGMPTLVDPQRGETLALAAIDEGSILALDVYGRALGQGLVKGKGLAEAVPLLRRAAAAGVPRSMARLGYYMATGTGVSVDLTGGIALARHAAQLGAPDGLADIAVAYEKGSIGGKPDLDAALALYAEAAGHRDDYSAGRLVELAQTNPRAQLLVQILLVRAANQAARITPNKAKGLTAALAKIRELAVAGNANAAAYLGYLHYWGASEAPGITKSEADAFHYTRQAAAVGDTWSLVNLATCYEHGIGTPLNYPLAAKVYWQAYVRGYQPGLGKVIRLLAFSK